MDTAWYVVLRDLMVMLAAAAVVATSVFLALVGWQLYRLGKDVYVEIQPLLASMQDTADTVRHTAGFVNERLYARDGAVGVAAGPSAWRSISAPPIAGCTRRGPSRTCQDRKRDLSRRSESDAPAGRKSARRESAGRV